MWLNEQGVSLTLIRYQAYRADLSHIVLTVSQLYPVPEVADFEIAPHTGSKPATPTSALPERPWTIDDLVLLSNVNSPTMLAVVDLCAESPGT